MSATPSEHDSAVWKRSILELPDDMFFSLMRTYLGNIKTPFHKPRLVEKLASLLSDRKTVLRIISLIDTYDAELLTAIDILREPAPGLLFHLFRTDRDYFSFHNHLMNLQERLLIYPAPDTSNLCINPYLYNDLKQQVLTPALLFPPAGTTAISERRGGTGVPVDEQVFLNEEHVWSMLSYIQHEQLSIKADGTFRKHTWERLRQVFPALTHEENPEGSYLLLNSLLKLRLTGIKGGVLQARSEGLKYLMNLRRPERHAHYWAAASLLGGTPEGSVVKQEGDFEHIGELASILLRCFSVIPQDTLFSRQTVQRFLIAVFLSRHAELIFDAGNSRFFDRIIHSLVRLRILVPRDSLVTLNPQLQPVLLSAENPKPLLINPDFTATLKPPLRFTDSLFLTSLLKITSFAAYPQYELNNETFVNARRFLTFERICSNISELTKESIPQNITFSLKAWENNYTSVKMMEGITLVLAKHWDRLVRHHPDFQEYVLADLGHGIYVMDSHTQSTWGKFLIDMGISPLPPILKSTGQNTDLPFTSPAAGTEPSEPEHVSPDTLSSLDLSSPFPRNEDFIRKATQVKHELMDELRKIRPSESRLKELSTRIEKKLILFPVQLKNPVHEPSFTEARGIDYAGKVRIIQQSLQSSSSLLELIERTSRGKPERHLVRPGDLEKTGRELVLTGIELPEEKPIRIRVEKIGYIKKWKGSLFFRPRDYRNR